MVCADTNSTTLADAVAAATEVASIHAGQIADGIRQVVARTGQPPVTVIVSGEGEFLARRALELAQPNAHVESMNYELGRTVSRAAPAHAVAVLAAEDAIA